MKSQMPTMAVCLWRTRHPSNFRVSGCASSARFRFYFVRGRLVKAAVQAALGPAWGSDHKTKRNLEKLWISGGFASASRGLIFVQTDERHTVPAGCAVSPGKGCVVCCIHTADHIEYIFWRISGCQISARFRSFCPRGSSWSRLHMCRKVDLCAGKQ
jgi:hypothetical protein